MTTVDKARWLVMGEYPFETLAGTPRIITGKSDQSYYHYISRGAYVAEVGKNVQAALWCLEGEAEGQVLYEPFGGLGFFALALNKRLHPRLHVTGDIDAECLQQLQVSLTGAGARGMEFRAGDCRVDMVEQRCDLAVLDFPQFGRSYFGRAGSWAEPFVGLMRNRPRCVVVTDGLRFLYHLHWSKMRDRYSATITSDPLSYIQHMSEFLWSEVGYSITRCAYHSRCFYYALEPVEPKEFATREFKGGSGAAGLRRLA